MESAYVQVEGLRLHYLAAGRGPTVLLLHGWPMSSFLWRNVIPPIAAHHRVLAPDLPGFGRSDKPLDRKYDFAFYRRIISGFLDALGVEQIGLVVHDLGGPVGLHWASHHPERVDSLALLNTVVYPELSLAVRAFVRACQVPMLHHVIGSQRSLHRALLMGVVDKAKLRDDAVDGVCRPFATPEARKALVRTSTSFDRSGLEQIARWLPTTKIPVRMIYGVDDRILPDIAKTAERLRRDVPHAVVTALPGCGHFLQEEQPEELGAMLAEFFESVHGDR